MDNNLSDMELFTACQAEAKESPINLSAVDPSPFMPPPMGIRSVLKMSDLKVREAWLRAIKSSGSLDKLKCRIVVRGDLQDTAMEDPGHLQHPLGPLKCS
jgi:hypothetical protein